MAKQGRSDGPSETVTLSASVLGGQDLVRLRTEQNIFYMSLGAFVLQLHSDPCSSLAAKGHSLLPTLCPSLQMPLRGSDEDQGS